MNNVITSGFDDLIDSLSVFSTEAKLSKSGVLRITVDSLWVDLPHTVWSSVSLTGFFVKSAVSDELSSRFKRIHADATPFRKKSHKKEDITLEAVFGLSVDRKSAKSFNVSKAVSKLMVKADEAKRVSKFVEVK